jgi:hypothetical protein
MTNLDKQETSQEATITGSAADVNANSAMVARNIAVPSQNAAGRHPIHVPLRLPSDDGRMDRPPGKTMSNRQGPDAMMPAVQLFPPLSPLTLDEACANLAIGPDKPPMIREVQTPGFSHIKETTYEIFEVMTPNGPTTRLRETTTHTYRISGLDWKWVGGIVAVGCLLFSLVARKVRKLLGRE